MSSSLVHKTRESTIDYKFCIHTLDSDPRTTTADLVGLANISLDLTFHNATDTHVYISRLLENANEPTIKKWLNICHEKYGYALAGISDSFNDLAYKDYENLNLSAQLVGAQALQCEKSFGAKEESHKSPLSLRNDDLNRLSDIVATIASILNPDLLV
ncbi:putative invertase inhibitor [Magnolia sinica]|uniref:putative invertase inhibitor n=1 Tax=Magnolia sinica TaxID=86752 RepID=UPI0026590865|nr:putative invertase inhibitor [Magnolia sinica]